jgi:hypothetical protein
MLVPGQPSCWPLECLARFERKEAVTGVTTHSVIVALDAKRSNSSAPPRVPSGRLSPL